MERKKIYVYDIDLNLVSEGTTEFMSNFVDNFVEAGYIVSWVKMDDDPEAIKFCIPDDAKDFSELLLFIEMLLIKENLSPA